MATTDVQPVPAFRRVVDAFVSPTQLFRDLQRNASWWPAFLLLILGALIFSAAVQKQVGWTATYEAILRQSPKQEAKFAQMPPGQVATAKSIGGKITAATSWGSPVIILIIAAIVAAVLLGTLNFGFGGRASFRELYAVYMYASLPMVLHSLLAVVALLAGLDAGSFLITNPLGSNLGYYLAPETAPWLMALASSIDIFTLWVVALLVIGCSIIARVSRAAAAVAVVGWWVLLLVVKVGAAALQS